MSSAFKNCRYRGDEAASVVVVCDQPTYDDDLKGKVFSDGQASLVMNLLDRAGFDLEDVLFINVIDNRVRSRGGITNEMALHAQAKLHKRIKAYSRSLVISLGNLPAFALGVLNKPAGCTGPKIRLHTHKVMGLEVPIVCSNNPFVVSRDPNQATLMTEDFRYAKEVASGKVRRGTPKVKVKMLNDPNDVNNLIKIASKPQYDLVAFDHESNHKDPYLPQFKIVTTAFYMGQESKLGSKIAHVWCGYDKLSPLFEQPVLDQFHEAFVEFYMGAGRAYDFLAWNSPFDAWATEAEYPELKGNWAGVLHDGMVSSWIVDSETPNGLKFNAAHYRGYIYADKIEEQVAAIAKRRGHVLKSQEDFDTIARWGKEPIAKELKRGGVSYSWPLKTLDKKVEAYAMCDVDNLVKYNALDAVITREVFDDHVDHIKKHNLVDPYEFRMRIVRRLLSGEKRGMKLDKKRNREFSKELKKIISKTEVLIRKRVKGLGWDKETEFNPNSPADLVHILYGIPSEVPSIDMDSVIEQTPRNLGRWELYDLRKAVGEWESEQHGDEKLMRRLLRMDSFDYDAAALRMRKKFLKAFPQFSYVNILPAKVYAKGLYEPIAYTKTGTPATAVAILQSLYEQKPNDFLHLILMYRKATKLKSTFVDAIYNKSVNGISYPHYNPIGTKSGRISGCVAAGTLVQTSTGLKPIEDLRTGDQVMSHSGIWIPCLGDAFPKPDSEMFEVTTAAGASIIVTQAHRFLTPTGWKTLSQLSVGDGITFSEDAEFTYDQAEAGQSNRVGESEAVLRETNSNKAKGVLPSGVYRNASLRRRGGSRRNKAHTQHFVQVLPAKVSRVELAGSKKARVRQAQIRQQARRQGTPGCLTNAGDIREAQRQSSICNSAGGKRVAVVRGEVARNPRGYSTTWYSRVDGRRSGNRANARSIRARISRRFSQVLRSSRGILAASSSGLPAADGFRLGNAKDKACLRLRTRAVRAARFREDVLVAEQARAASVFAANSRRDSARLPSQVRQVSVRFQSRSCNAGRSRWKLPHSGDSQSKRQAERKASEAERIQIIEDFNGFDRFQSNRSVATIARIEYKGIGTPWDVSTAVEHSYIAHGFVNHNSDFNPQNFPKYIRGQFKARKGYRIITFDLSQAEIRAVAAFSEDPDLIAALNSQDIHRNVASMVFEKPESEVTDVERNACKAVVFGILYGRGKKALSLALGWTEDYAQEFIDKFFGRFPKLKLWIDTQIENASNPPYACYTPWGTRRSLRNILSSDKAERSHIERVAVNSPIQGAAGEYTLWLICEIFDRIEEVGYDCHLLNTTHDSVSIEVPKFLIEVEKQTDKDGNVKEIPRGPVRDIIDEVLALPAPVEPLCNVSFPADFDLDDYWYGEPNLKKALDPKNKIFRWDLIDDTSWNKEDREELEFILGKAT